MKAMFVAFVLFSICISHSAGDTNESNNVLIEQEARLIDEIASNIVDDVVATNRLVLKMKQEKKKQKDITDMIKNSAKNTILTVEPKLEKLAEFVSNPQQTAKQIVDIIKQKTASAFMKSAADKGDDLDIQPRAFGGLANTFVNLVFHGLKKIMQKNV